MPLLIQELVAPMVIHMLLRLNTEHLSGIDLPDIDTVCDIFTDGFIRLAGKRTASPSRPPRR
ncbi:hypothetical protein [Mycobacterium sp. HNNTM2301]|uniref:hypothetical protein n=1 Tax=Mycobacterium hainanense TaxID=3289775 RepID=UPI0035A5C240